MQTQPQNAHPISWLMPGLIIACLQIASFLFSLPWFQVGVWFQVEPMMVAHYLLAALGLIWLIFASKRGIVHVSLAHPLWYAIGAWLLWQCLTVALSPTPWRAWYGATNTGEGTSWWLAWAAQTLLIATLWQYAWCRKSMLTAAFLSIAYLTTMHALFFNAETIGENINFWLPNPWPDYMAFIIGFFWIAFFCSKESASPLLFFICLAIGLAGLLMSHNITGIALLTAAIAIGVIHHASPLCQRLLRPTRFWRMLACLSCVLPMGWYVYSFYFEHSQEMGYAGQESFLAAKDEGMGSRLVINQVGISALLHEPQRLIMGPGYGHFTDDLLKYGLVDGVAIYVDGARKPNWFLLDGTSHHSHSQPLEALLSFGIPGLVLWLALPMILIATLPSSLFWRCMPLIVALTALAYVWFQIPHVLGFHALAFAAIMALRKTHDPKPSATRWYSILLMAVVLLLFASAYGKWQVIRYSERVMHGINTLQCDQLSDALIAEDLARGGLHLNDIGVKFTLSAIKLGQDANRDLARCFDKLFVATQAAFEEPRAGALVRLLALNLHYELFLNLGAPVFDDARENAIKTIEDVGIKFSSYAPLRDDKMSVFLTNLDGYSKGSKAKKFELLDRILTTTPNHRPALWLMGDLLMSDPDSYQAGLEMKKTAASRHVERVFPITNKELQELDGLQ
ncbi:MAG: O-antigen ligase family protein [Rickettsiales bacterium]|nr:O-antigen ligase family protein [Rickettsiales bacterium]